VLSSLFDHLCDANAVTHNPVKGVLHLRVHGKGGKVRYLPLHPGTAELVTDYLEAAGHGGETAEALFRPGKNNTGGTVEGAITADGIYKMVKHYATRVGVNIEGVWSALTTGHGSHQRTLQRMVTKITREYPGRRGEHGRSPLPPPAPDKHKRQGTL